RSSMGGELRRRLSWTLYTNITMIDGEPWDVGRYSSRFPIHGLYVHPETGILCMAKDKPYKKKEKPVEKVCWNNDVWFELETFQRPALKCGCVHFKIYPP